MKKNYENFNYYESSKEEILEVLTEFRKRYYKDTSEAFDRKQKIRQELDKEHSKCHELEAFYMKKINEERSKFRDKLYDRSNYFKEYREEPLVEGLFSFLKNKENKKIEEENKKKSEIIKLELEKYDRDNSMPNTNNLLELFDGHFEMLDNIREYNTKLNFYWSRTRELSKEIYYPQKDPCAEAEDKLRKEFNIPMFIKGYEIYIWELFETKRVQTFAEALDKLELHKHREKFEELSSHISDIESRLESNAFQQDHLMSQILDTQQKEQKERNNFYNKVSRMNSELNENIRKNKDKLDQIELEIINK